MIDTEYSHQGARMSGRRHQGGIENLYCSFCGKSQHEVRKLIAGPTVYICDECIDLCNDIIAEQLDPKLMQTLDYTLVK